MRKEEFDSEEFDLEENQDIKNNEYKFKKGNTLDYYNEDLSRKAVGRLFEEKNDDMSSIVKGYHDDLQPEDVQQTIMKPQSVEGDLPPDEIDADPVEKSKDFVKGYVKVPMKRATPQKTASAYRNQGKPPSQAKEVSVKLPGAEAEEEDESFSLYRQKEKKNDVHARPAVKITRDQKPEQKSVKKIPPNPEEEPEKDFEDEDYDDFRERYKNREYIPSPNQPRSTRKTVAEGGTYPGEYYEEYEDGTGSFSGLKMALAVICFIFLVILAILVYQINSTKAQLKEAQAAIVTDTEADKELQSYKIKNEALENENAALKKENEELKSLIPTQEENAPANNTDQDPDQTVQTAATGETYIVQSGDSLSKISKKFYDVDNEYQRIKEANNMTNDAISPGQVLIIPPK